MIRMGKSIFHMCVNSESIENFTKHISGIGAKRGLVALMCENDIQFYGKCLKGGGVYLTFFI